SDDMAVVEVNEAFASVALQFLHDAGLEERVADVNPNGGGISLGHPRGARRATALRRCASGSARRSPRSSSGSSKPPRQKVTHPARSSHRHVTGSPLASPHEGG